MTPVRATSPDVFSDAADAMPALRSMRTEPLFLVVMRYITLFVSVATAAAIAAALVLESVPLPPVAHAAVHAPAVWLCFAVFFAAALVLGIDFVALGVWLRYRRWWRFGYPTRRYVTVCILRGLVETGRLARDRAEWPTRHGLELFDVSVSYDVHVGYTMTVRLGGSLRGGSPYVGLAEDLVSSWSGGAFAGAEDVAGEVDADAGCYVLSLVYGPRSWVVAARRDRAGRRHLSRQEMRHG